MKRKTVKAFLSKAAAVSMAASMMMSYPVMAEGEDPTEGNTVDVATNGVGETHEESAQTSDAPTAGVSDSSDTPEKSGASGAGSDSDDGIKPESQGLSNAGTNGNGESASGDQNTSQNQGVTGKEEQSETKGDESKDGGKNPDNPNLPVNPSNENKNDSIDVDPKQQDGQADLLNAGFENKIGNGAPLTASDANAAAEKASAKPAPQGFSTGLNESPDETGEGFSAEGAKGNSGVDNANQEHEENSDDRVWVDPGVKKTVRPSSNNDQQRNILEYTNKNNIPEKDSKGNPVKVLSRPSNENDPEENGEEPEEITGVNIDGGQNISISTITNGKCNKAWLNPQNILLYAEDDVDNNFKAGDKIVYEKGGKKYNLYFTDDNNSTKVDTALVIPEENTIDNISEGLEIAMVDWGGGRSQGQPSTQDTYIKQKLYNGYKNGNLINLEYNSENVKGKEVNLFNGKIGGQEVQERKTPSEKGILVDGTVGEVNAKFILLPGSDGKFPTSGDLYYYGQYKGKDNQDGFLCYTIDDSGAYGCIGKKTIQDIHNHDNFIIAVTCEKKTNNIENTAVQYVTNESGVFGDRLESDGYPKISEKYKNSTEEGADSLGILFDYDKNKNKFEQQEGKIGENNNKYSNLNMPHFGVDSTANHWDSYFLTNGLLQNEDGYWVYNSNQNFASLAPYGYQIYDTVNTDRKYVTSATNGSVVRFTLFNETGTPDSGSTNDDYHKGNFLPYDTLNLAVKDDQTENKNQYEITKTNKPDYLFGMQVSGKFIQTPGGKFNGKDMIYEFSGDDDMVVYIDGKLALDLSGVHDAVSGSINFADGTVTTHKNIQNAISSLRFSNIIQQDKDQYETKSFSDLNLTENGAKTFEDGSLHDIKIFYMERGRGASDLNMKLNLQTAAANTVASSVKKTWNDGSKDHDADEVEVMLESSEDGGKSYAGYDLDDSTKDIDGAKLNKDNDWSYSVNKLPHYVTIKEGETVASENRYKFDETKGEYVQDQKGNLKEIKYRWVEKNKVDDNPSSPKYSSSSTKEKPAEPYKSSEDKKTGILAQFFNIVNTLLGKSTVEQKWVDADDKFQTQPDQVSMTLESSTDGTKWQTYDSDPDTKEIDKVTATLTKGSWQATYNLPKYDRNGNEIFYRWNDDDSEAKKNKGYRFDTAVSSENGSLDQTYTIVNTLQAVTSVEKTWDDAGDKDGMRPDSIELTLHKVDANRKDSVVKTVVVTQDTNWTYSEPVDRADENGELKYYWTEGSVPGYRQSEYAQYALGDNSLDEKTTITNSHRPSPETSRVIPSIDPESKPETTPEPSKPEAEDETKEDEEVTPAPQPSEAEAEEEKTTDTHTEEKTPSAPEQSNAPAVPQKTIAENPVKPEAKTLNTAVPVAEAETSKSTDESIKTENVQTGDVGDIGGSAAAMAASAAGLGILAFFTRRRKHSR